MKLGVSLEALVGRVIDTRFPQEALEGLLGTIGRTTKELGLQVVEIPFDAAFIYPSLFTQKALLRLGQFAREQGLFFTAHLPYWWVDLSSLNEWARQAAVHSVLLGVEKARLLGPLAYVLHPAAERWAEIAGSSWGAEEKAVFWGRMEGQARESLREVAAAGLGRALCLENGEGMAFLAVADLARGIGAELCLDVGHAMKNGENPLALAKAHLDRIGVMHLHDVILPQGKDSGWLRDHQPLGHGLAPVGELIDLLRRRRWEGALILELTRREDLFASVGWLEGQGLWP